MRLFDCIIGIFRARHLTAEKAPVTAVSTHPALSFLIVGMLSLNAALAQNSTIQGMVIDRSEAVLPGAEVTATDVATGITRRAVTNDVGLYTLPLLKEGSYLIKCAMLGFKSYETTIRLEVGQVARVDFRLEVGEVSEVVKVTATAELLQSKAHDVGQVIDEKRIQELPLNGRNYLELAQLSVGVVRSRQVGTGHRGGQEGSFQSAGLHAAQNKVLLDGVDNNPPTSGGPLGFQAQSVKPSIDAISEFKVITNNTSAEHGYRMGAKVLVSTKSGTNEFHGSLYEFHRNDALAANNFFANRAGAERPKFLRNQFGGTFGGPIIRDKTFFFLSYQGTRIRKGLSATSSVPSQNIRQGDFSKEPPQRSNIFDPAQLTGTGANAVRAPFPNNTIPTNRMDPVALKVIGLYPLPNIPGREHLPNNFFSSPSQRNDADQYDFRIDHNFFNSSHRLFVRYSLRDELAFTPGRLPFPAMGGDGETAVLDSKNVAVTYSATITPKVLNEFRFGWTSFPSRFDLPFEENFNQKLGIKGAPGDTFGDGEDKGFALFSPAGFTPVGPRSFWPNINEMKVIHIADNVLWELGAHSLKLGGEYHFLNISRFAHRFRRGSFNFSGQYTAQRPNVPASRAVTGNSMADFLLGSASGGLISNIIGEDINVPYYGVYVQDDWKITPKLTLNLGLRWELFEGPTYPNVADQTVTRFAFRGDLSSRQPLLDVEFIEWEAPKDDKDCGCKRDLKNFAPRLGLAYRLKDKTVIRAGAGIYYGEADMPSAETTRFFTGQPKSLEFNLVQPSFERSNLIVQQGFPALPPVGPADKVAGRPSVTWVPEFLPTTYTSQWFLDVQHGLPWDTLLTVGYNGSSSTHLSIEYPVSVPLTPHPSLPWFHPSRLRIPFLQIFAVVDNMLSANYHAFSVKAEKRYSGGLTFLSSFTWAHGIDYGREILNNTPGTSFNRFSDQHDRRRNRASSDLDRRLAYSLSSLYEFPFGPNRRWLQSGPASWFLGGWQVGGILSLLSGMPQDHQVIPDTQNNMGRPRGNLVRDPNLPASQRSVERWFDTGFVVPSVPGTIGNAGRNLIKGPPWNNFDFVASKNFYLPWDGHHVQFRFEAFNLTNTPHFGFDSGGIGNTFAVGTPGVGIIDRADEPRLIQFGLKYVF